MRVFLTFRHRVIERQGGIPVVLSHDLGTFTVPVSIGTKAHSTLESEMDRDFHGGPPRLTPRINETYLELVMMDTEPADDSLGVPPPPTT